MAQLTSLLWVKLRATYSERRNRLKKKLDMNSFKNITVSVNGDRESNAMIEISASSIYINFINEKHTMYLHREGTFPQRQQQSVETFTFYTNDLIKVTVRFGSEDARTMFRKAVFPYWNYCDRNMAPRNSPESSPESQVTSKSSHNLSQN